MSKQLNEQNLNEGKELNDVLKDLDEDSKKIILVYASGLRDRQMITETGSKSA